MTSSQSKTVVDYNNISTRISQDKSVHEFQLQSKNGTPLTGITAKMSTKEFFQNCNDRINVIIDPQCSPGEWYPFLESGSMRKIAPQFRSRGVGYIRLGDDMSKNGCAFLSNDGGKSVFSSIGKTYGSTKTNVSGEIVSNENDPNEICDQLEANELKWDKKTRLIDRLGKVVSSSQPPYCATRALKVLEDILCSKKTNVFLLRSTIQALGSIGCNLGKTLVRHSSWMAIFEQTLTLLCDKKVGAVARETLTNLHGKCFLLSNTVGSIAETIGLGEASRPQTGKETKQVSKCSGIIEWLATTMIKEAEMSQVEAAVDASVLKRISNIFFYFVGHRDQKCRKNGIDGIVNTIVYASKQLRMKMEEALMLCAGLKNINPRGWKTVLQRVKTMV